MENVLGGCAVNDANVMMRHVCFSVYLTVSFFFIPSVRLSVTNSFKMLEMIQDD